MYTHKHIHLNLHAQGGGLMWLRAKELDSGLRSDRHPAGSRLQKEESVKESLSEVTPTAQLQVRSNCFN
jgi:hypothetical protein